MARFRQTVVLEPVPRTWFDQAVGVCFDMLTEYLTDAGDPPAAETQYELPDAVTTVYLESWQRDGVTAGRMCAMESDMASIWSVRLDSPGNPRIADFSGDLRGRRLGTGWLTAGTGTVRVDLPTWWDGAVREGVGPAITGQGKHVFVHAAATVTVTPARDSRWQVTIDVTLRGRGLLRPFTSAAFLLAKSKIDRGFTKAVNELARGWNTEVPPLVAMHQDELRELITKELSRTSGS